MNEIGSDAMEGAEAPQKVVKRRPKVGVNGVISVNHRPKSEYICPSGAVSTLDIRTRLRITEAELAIVQREVSDLMVERSTLESSARQWEDSWRFAVQECGRVVDQRDELQRKVELLEQAVRAAHHQTSESHKGSKKGKVSRADLDQCRLALETQTHVCETLEHERDQANDDYEFAQARLHTLMQQYQELASTCSEVARERDKARAEVQLLREELHRYEPETDNIYFPSRDQSSKKHEDPSRSCDPDDTPPTSSDPQVLAKQIREMRGERDRFQSLYEQAVKKAEQSQKQLFRAEEDRRQALATSEALTALWQKKFEKAQNENYELRQELLSAQDRISHLHERLAMVRLQQARVRPSPPENPSHPHPPPSTVPYSNSIGGYITTPHRSQSLHVSLSQSAGHVQPPFPFTPEHYALSQDGASPGIVGIVKPVRHTSLKSHHELISPSNSSSHHTPHTLPAHTPLPHMFDDDIHENENLSTDDEGSWI